ncbi:MAG: UrcA family protein, partial [Sphingomonadaceae bacterium]
MTNILSKLAMAAAAALASTTLVSASAMAADIVATAEARAAEVRYGDLDLTSKAGRSGVEGGVGGGGEPGCAT